MSNISKISNLPIGQGETIQCQDIRPRIFNLIQDMHPTFTKDDFMSLDELNEFRRMYLSKLMEEERGELAQIDKDVLLAIKSNKILSENVEEEHENPLTLGEKMADGIAQFGGSWTFILFFFGSILFWILLNIFWYNNQGFDPYPYILLNLVLSCLASIQAPIIMMSQNRQEQKDRIRSEHDYQINLKAELEIQILSEKLDHLLIHQNRKLLEIQEMQIDYLEDLIKKVKST
ncbi:MAG: hypothetical protein RIS99_672 [Bacteroidota bacterium]